MASRLGKKGYVARLSNSNKVSGDDFYTDENGAITLPLGTISIEETKAPKGYFLKGAKLNVTDTATGTTATVEDSNYVAQITKQYTGAKLQFGNYSFKKHIINAYIKQFNLF